MMKHLQLTKLGDPSQPGVLNIVEKAKPEPGPEQVLIEVQSLSINPVDYKMCTGQFPMKDKNVGSDVAGVIVAVGSTIKSSLKVGDEIYCDAIRCGAMAEYVAIHEAKVALKPPTLSFNEAAAMPLAGLTALEALRDHGQLAAGQKVLIFGGSGGVGTFALQLAKAMGATIVATTSTNQQLCEELGATHVVNYKTQDVVSALKEHQFDLVFDAVGGYDYWCHGWQLLKRNGRYVTIAGDNVPMSTMVPRLVYRKLMSAVPFYGAPAYTVFLTANNGSADLPVLAEYVASGKLRPVMDTTPPFAFDEEGVRGLFGKIMEGRTKGKLCMEVKSKA